VICWASCWGQDRELKRGRLAEGGEGEEEEDERQELGGDGHWE